MAAAPLRDHGGGFRVVGRSLPQLALPDKVTGRARYVADLEIPRALHVAAVRSPHPRARIVRIDTSRAKAMAGVRAVLSSADVPRTRWGVVVPDQFLLAHDEVRFIGEEVVVVAAETREAAVEAAEAVVVDYEPLPPVLTVEEALAPDAPRVHADRSNIAREYHIIRGDIDAGFAAADEIHEATYGTSLVYQGYMEPVGSVAVPEASGRVTVYGSTQSIFLARGMIAKAVGIPVSRVRVIQPTVGGGFGGKLMEDPNLVLTALLALRTGRPVRWILGRLEEFLASRPHMPAKIRLRMGVTRDGLLTAKEMHVTADNGAYSGFAPEILRVTTMRADNLYRIPHLRADSRLLYTNTVPTGAYRGFGNPQGHLALESHIDMLAEAIGMDPVELRLRNAVDAGETSIHGWKLGSCGLKRCLTSAAEAIDWKRRAGSTRRGPVSRGLGIAAAIHVSGNRQGLGETHWDGSAAEVRMNEDGSPTLVCGEGELGQGAHTVFAQIVAEELGVRPHDVVIAPVDTDTTPFCLGAYASRLTVVAGNAVRRAALECRRQLVDIAASVLEAAPDDLVLADGAVAVRGSPARRATLATLCAAHQFRQGGTQIVGRGTFDAPTEPADAGTLYGNIAPAYSFAAEAAEVEVDWETGQWRLLRLVVADDAGRALNPQVCEGQIHGAVVQAIGMSTSEELTLDGGQVVNGSFAEYHMPKAVGLPAIETILVETEEPNGPYGAKGVSECSIVPLMAAIANALHDATGRRLTRPPFTAERVLAALRAAAR
jgi:CO/xanthine dehydrogenase Mo-binding subunit